MATARHRRRWASTARLWPRGSSSAARSTQREQISALGVADVSFRMQLSMEETTPASPSTGMGSSARSCARSRLPSSGAHGRSDCRSGRSRGNACCAVTGGRHRGSWGEFRKISTVWVKNDVEHAYELRSGRARACQSRGRPGRGSCTGRSGR